MPFGNWHHSNHMSCLSYGLPQGIYIQVLLLNSWEGITNLSLSYKQVYRDLISWAVSTDKDYIQNISTLISFFSSCYPLKSMMGFHHVGHCLLCWFSWYYGVKRLSLSLMGESEEHNPWSGSFVNQNPSVNTKLNFNILEVCQGPLFIIYLYMLVKILLA